MRKTISIGISIILYMVSMFTAFPNNTPRTDPTGDHYEVGLETVSHVEETTTEEETFVIVIPTTIIEESTVTTTETTIEVTTIPEETATPEVTTTKEENTTEKITEREATTPEVTTTKKKEKETTKKEKQTTTKKVVNNKVPKQKQGSGAIGSDNVTFIKNTVLSAMNGAYDYNLENLAIYMANNGKSDAQSCLNSLCENTTLKVTSNIATVTTSSLETDDLIDVGIKFADTLGGSVNKYGVGIYSYVNSSKEYVITVVVVAQLN